MAHRISIPPANHPEDLGVAGAILRLVADRYDPGRVVQPETTFAELHAVYAAPMLHEIEELFGVTVGREEWRGVQTVGDLIALVAAKRAT